MLREVVVWNLIIWKTSANLTLPQVFTVTVKFDIIFHDCIDTVTCLRLVEIGNFLS